MKMLLFKLYCYLPRNKFTSPIKNLLSTIACPYSDKEHFHHDGCPCCEGRKINKFDKWPPPR